MLRRKSDCIGGRYLRLDLLKGECQLNWWKIVDELILVGANQVENGVTGIKSKTGEMEEGYQYYG